MQKVIEKSQQLTALLIEYREAKTYESKLYHLVRQPDTDKALFMLIDIKTGKIMADGWKQRIKSYIRLRKINPWKIYNVRVLFK
jgi:hypothetical protein